MSDSLSERYGRPALKVLVVFLAAGSVAGAYTHVSTDGLAGAPDAFVNLYIAALIVWGVFVEGFDTTRFRALLYAGVVLWGAIEIATGPTASWAYALIVGGLLLLAHAGYREYERRTKPVYER